MCDVSFIVLCYRYLGHIYVAEALVSQGRITEAVQHLSPETIVDVGLTTSANEGG